METPSERESVIQRCPLFRPKRPQNMHGRADHQSWGRGTPPLHSFEIAHLESRWPAQRDPSVTNGKPLPCMVWLFNLVDHGHRIILRRDAALPLCIRQHLIRTQTECSGALAGSEIR